MKEIQRFVGTLCVLLVGSLLVGCAAVGNKVVRVNEDGSTSYENNTKYLTIPGMRNVNDGELRQIQQGQAQVYQSRAQASYAAAQALNAQARVEASKPIPFVITQSQIVDGEVVSGTATVTTNENGAITITPSKVSGSKSAGGDNVLIINVEDKRKIEERPVVVPQPAPSQPISQLIVPGANFAIEPPEQRTVVVQPQVVQMPLAYYGSAPVIYSGGGYSYSYERSWHQPKVRYYNSPPAVYYNTVPRSGCNQYGQKQYRGGGVVEDYKGTYGCDAPCPPGPQNPNKVFKKNR